MDKASYYLLLFVVPLLFAGCAQTNYLTMSVTNPAPVYIPQDLKKVGIINRSDPIKQNKKWDDLDKVLSAEGKKLDKEGAGATIEGLKTELQKNSRFTSVKAIKDNTIKGVGMGVFPASLSWDEVENICKKHNVDVIFELSYYDTETNVEYLSTPVEVNTAIGVKVPAVEHTVNVTTLVKTGWRIYDPMNNIVQDKYWANKTVRSSGTGINPAKAIAAIASRKQNVLEASKGLGMHYSFRIIPKRVRVRRTYYKRGTNNFEIAHRRAVADDWDGAAELWNKETSNPDPKVAGRAYYNMAISNEINGNLDEALSLAGKSYTDYNNKLALDYLNILKRRQAKNQELKRQQERDP